MVTKYKNYISGTNLTDLRVYFGKEAAKELEEENKLISDAERFYKSQEELKEIIVMAEKGINPKFAGSIEPIFISEGLQGETSVVLPAISIALYAHSDSKDAREAVDSLPDREYARTVVKQAENYMENMPIHENSIARYNKTDDRILLCRLPPQFMTDIKTSVMRPLSLFVEHKDELEGFVATINHEVTHAYLEKKAEIHDDKQSQAVDEAAANAVENLILGRTESPKYATRAYENMENLDRGIVHTALRIFLEIGIKQSSPKEGSRKIREVAYETLQEYDGDNNILEILRENSDSREYKNLEKTARTLMEVEQDMMQIFLSMNIIEPDIYRRRMRGYLKSYQKLFKKKNVMAVEDDKGKLKKANFRLQDVHSEIEKIEQYFESKDMKEEMVIINRLKKDFRELTDEYHNEKKLAKNWIEGDEKEIENIQNDFMSTNQTLNIVGEPSRRELREYLLSVIDDEIKLCKAAEKQAKKMLSTLNKIHDEEEKSARLISEYYSENELSDVKKLLKMTKKDYRKVENAEMETERVISKLKEARREIENT